MDNNILMLISGLKSAKENNNKIQIEFTSALLYKYFQEGIDFSKYIKEEELKEGLQYFKKRKKKFLYRAIIFSLFTGIACFAFAHFYLLLPLLKSIAFLIVGFLGDYVIKIKVNKIVFVNETKKIYSKYVDKNLLKIRESEDVSRLWI